jgi:hypothetical protein
MHLLPGVAIQPNLELKTQPKPVLGSLPLAFALPDFSYFKFNGTRLVKNQISLMPVKPHQIEHVNGS